MQLLFLLAVVIRVEVVRKTRFPHPQMSPLFQSTLPTQIKINQHKTKGCVYPPIQSEPQHSLTHSLSLRYRNTILSLKPRRVTRVVSAGGPGVGGAGVGVRERERERDSEGC